MWITVNGINATEIDDRVINRVLNLYPEERLRERPVFEHAFNDSSIDFHALKDESEKILVPWQMFFLTGDNLDDQVAHIEKQRQHKLTPKLLAKRRGSGSITSKRIIDRLIRQQNFLKDVGEFPQNAFCGSLKRLQVANAAGRILAHFSIDRDVLWGYRTKGTALEYLIGRLEEGNINVSRGVLAHKILPNWQVVGNDIYKNTSGFVIQDEKIPFIFLPSEINPDEVEGRQIYTLIYLLAVIGLEKYDYILAADLKARTIDAKGVAARLHRITAELLMPANDTEKLRGTIITSDVRDELARKYKVSPSAIVITLRMRNIISESQFHALKPPPYVQKRADTPRTPKVSTSVKKFCGKKTFQVMNTAIQNGSLKSVQAQYLIWGGINKKGYRKYRDELGI